MSRDTANRIPFGVQPYKVYVALLTQASSAAPTAAVLEDSLGALLTFARTSAGIYTVTSDNAILVANKTLVFCWQINNASNDRVYVVSHLRTSTTIITINTKFQDAAASGGQPADDVLSETPFEIRVYQ